MKKIIIEINPELPLSRDEFRIHGCGTVTVVIRDLPITAIAQLSNLSEMIAQQFRGTAKIMGYPENQVEDMLKSILARGQERKGTCAG